MPSRPSLSYIFFNVSGFICKKYNINSDGKLEIEWSEGDHTSYFDPSWLRENCYTLKNKEKYVSPYQLWGSSLVNNLQSIRIYVFLRLFLFCK